MTDKGKAILSGCLNGEKPAWDAFVLQYSSLVYHTIRKTLALYHAEPRPDLVEDLYQDVFLNILKDDFRKLRQFRGDRGCSLASWLRVVASRLTIDYLRSQKQHDLGATESLSAEQSDRPDSLISNEEEMLLLQTLEALSPRDRILVDLVYRQDLSAEDVASILKISIGALYT